MKIFPCYAGVGGNVPVWENYGCCWHPFVLRERVSLISYVAQVPGAQGGASVTSLSSSRPPSPRSLGHPSGAGLSLRNLPLQLCHAPETSGGEAQQCYHHHGSSRLPVMAASLRPLKIMCPGPWPLYPLPMLHLCP